MNIIKTIVIFAIFQMTGIIVVNTGNSIMKNKIIYLIFATVLLLGLVGIKNVNALWDNSLNQNLSIYYDFNSTTNIFDGSNNLTTVGNPSIVFNNTNCLIGNCSQFKVDGQLKIPGNNNVNLGKSGDISFSGWIRTKNGGVNVPEIFYRTVSADNEIIQIDVISSQIFYIGAQYNGSVISTTPESNNQWYMITYTRNSSGYGKVYINGTLIGQGQSSLGNNNSDFYLGIRPNAPAQNFTGQMDEMGWWNKVLSSDDINNLYNNGNGIVFNNNPTYSIDTYNYNSTTYETSLENYQVNLTLNNTSLNSATFYYNGTAYATTMSGNNPYTFATSINIPTVNSQQNINFYWNFNLTSGNVYSLNHTQSIYPITFSLCNATINVPYINYTFADEETNLATTAAITSSFNYYFGNGAVTKTYTFQNTSANPSYGFCFSPSNKTINVLPSIQYSNSNSTIRTNNAINPLVLTNSTTNTLLYLLKTTDGIYSSYQVATITQTPISNALVSVYLNNNLIESKTTDSAGIATFFLNPNSVYTITASKSGFATSTVSVNPSQTQYTITLGSTAGNNATYYNYGINISISPMNQYLNQSTNYNFLTSLTSSIYTLDNWGFNITDGNSVFATTRNLPQSTTSSSILLNSGTNSSLSLIVWWTINGTTTSLTKSYTIESLTGNGFSIYNGIIDLKSYLNNGGIFGLTGSGMNILIFIIIILVTGISTYRFGLSSPAVIAGIVTIQVFLFDIVFGLIYYDPGFFPNKLPHIATIFMGVILITLIIREGTSY